MRLLGEDTRGQGFLVRMRPPGEDTREREFLVGNAAAGRGHARTGVLDRRYTRVICLAIFLSALLLVHTRQVVGALREVQEEVACLERIP